MLIVYRILINLIFILSPIIIIIRLLKKKEDIKRFKEKFCFFSKRRRSGKIVWFHGASVGELQSVVPIFEILEKNKKINQILVTSNTLSSAKVIEKLKLKKVTHQFYPIDTNFLSKKFISYWKPSSVFFIDSEVWPNMVKNLKNQKIPIMLLNGRITKKTFKRWKLFPRLSKKIFSNFDSCLASSKESNYYLKKLGAKKTKFFGNLKFTQSENEKIMINKKLKNVITSRKSWCASSTHASEEIFCAKIHIQLKKKYPNLLTIIIPRHIERSETIFNELKNMNLKTYLFESNNKIGSDAEIIIINSYGKTKSVYSVCKNIFLGGSLINHGGQNPLEATRYGCNIIHGPHVSNFREIYKFLKMKKISYETDNELKTINKLYQLFARKNNSLKNQKQLSLIGKKILNFTCKEIDLLL